MLKESAGPAVRQAYRPDVIPALPLVVVVQSLVGAPGIKPYPLAADPGGVVDSPPKQQGTEAVTCLIPGDSQLGYVHGGLAALGHRPEIRIGLARDGHRSYRATTVTDYPDFPAIDHRPDPLRPEAVRPLIQASAVQPIGGLIENF